MGERWQLKKARGCHPLRVCCSRAAPTPHSEALEEILRGPCGEGWDSVAALESRHLVAENAVNAEGSHMSAKEGQA